MSKLTPQKKAGFWYLIRRVPLAVRHLDKRQLVKMTTGIRIVDDPRGFRAARVIADLNEQLEKDWSDLAAGQKPRQRARSSAQRRLLLCTASNTFQPQI